MGVAALDKPMPQRYCEPACRHPITCSTLDNLTNASPEHASPQHITQLLVHEVAGLNTTP
jgi:hypothetical protein